MTPRATEPAGAPPRISETVIAAAAKGRAGLLTVDAQQDLRFTGSQSVVAQGIRSCLCVPVWADNRILGMLVLDRGFVDPFTADDLELTTLVGYQAALAIERARFVARNAQLQEERRRLLRHFPPELATLVLAQEGGERDLLEPRVHEEATVLFADVEDFAGLAGRLPPAELATLLGDFFRSMTEAVFEERGVVVRRSGDGVMAVFGAPVPVEDAAIRGLRCAWRMLERVAETNRGLPVDRRFAIRVGVSTGPVIAGDLGADEGKELTVLGDAVSVASRLEAMAAPGSIYVGQETAERAGEAFSFLELGRRVVRGREAPVDVLQVEAPRGIS
jgi:adenylate cyclase